MLVLPRKQGSVSLVASLMQKKLRERESSREHSSDSNVPETYPLQPIGHLQSCFTKRSGTPRQPLLVPAARARLVLRYSASSLPATLQRRP